MYDAAIKLLEKIDSFGYEAYMIGGYPRDLYLKRTITDVDICTDATPMELHQIFSEIVKTSSEYGTTTVIFENVKFEITTFRKEFKYTDMRRPEKIEYVYTLKEDIKRRDFVINTLAIDKNGNQIDLLGAKNDLDNKIIRTVGDPKIRLKEDALRILRAIRFATTLNFELDNRLRIYIKKYGKLLRKLSKDRKKEELDMIFTSSNKAYGIKLLIDLNLINYLDMPKLKQIKITPTAIVTWSQLDVLDKYNFNTIERETIDKINEVKNKDILDKKNTVLLWSLYMYFSCRIKRYK
jgi:tRNA nucleotidyltransferase (CCA-adding enzyme)